MKIGKIFFQRLSVTIQFASSRCFCTNHFVMRSVLRRRLNVDSFMETKCEVLTISCSKWNDWRPDLQRIHDCGWPEDTDEWLIGLQIYVLRCRRSSTIELRRLIGLWRFEGEQGYFKFNADEYGSQYRCAGTDVTCGWLLWLSERQCSEKNCNLWRLTLEVPRRRQLQ